MLLVVPMCLENIREDYTTESPVVKQKTNWFSCLVLAGFSSQSRLPGRCRGTFNNSFGTRLKSKSVWYFKKTHYETCEAFSLKSGIKLQDLELDSVCVQSGVALKKHGE